MWHTMRGAADGASSSSSAASHGMAEWPQSDGLCLRGVSQESVVSDTSSRRLIANCGLPCLEGGAVAMVGLKSLAATSELAQWHYETKNCFVFYTAIVDTTLRLAHNTQEFQEPLRRSVENCISEAGFLVIPIDLSELAACIYGSQSSLGVAVVPESAMDLSGDVREDLSAFSFPSGELFEQRHDFEMMAMLADTVIQPVGQLKTLIIAQPRPEGL